MKIAALTPTSGPYISARYEAFCKKSPNDSLVLIELSSFSDDSPWLPTSLQVSYQRVILSKIPFEKQNLLTLARRIISILNKIRPEVIVSCGYGVKGMLYALFWGMLWNKPVVLLSESKEDDFLRTPLSESIKKWIIKKYKSALVGGEAHKRYLKKLGFPDEAIFFGYDVVDNSFFHPSRCRKLRVPIDKPYFLSINRFIPKKNLLFLLSSYATYRKKKGVDAWDLILCGDGHLRPGVEKEIIELGIKAFVHLPGFLEQERLLPYFGHAKCFIHASLQEQWGLVVNEAMAAGLPILVSNRCGCFKELVNEGINGFGFDPENKMQLVDLMLKVSQRKFKLDEMGNAALEYIRKFSPDYFAEGLMQAINYALGLGSDIENT